MSKFLPTVKMGATCLALVALLLCSASVARADVVTISTPLTTTNVGDAWNIFYSGSTSTTVPSDYVTRYLDGWATRDKYYFKGSSWYTPKVGEGNWISPSNTSSAALGLYAYSIDLGTYFTGNEWTLRGSLASDDMTVGAYLIGTDKSVVDFNFRNLVSPVSPGLFSSGASSQSALHALPPGGIALDGLVDGMNYDLVVFIMNTGGAQGLLSNLVLDKRSNEVPEPATLVILALGLTGLGLAQRRRKR